ncbi:MAG: DUF480 domain-containing protein [Holophagales bacterium]|nr:DUF480 domain-containing protein [Holophagales bacterium]
MPRLPRHLDRVECRVLGALLEKEQSTPEYYPLTLKALVAACNQKNNREPVLDLAEREVEAALRRLFEDVLVWRAEGARALRWSHNLDQRWRLDPRSKAVMTLLLLRGEQTPGELRGRSDRLHPFDTPAEVEGVLADLATGPEPLVVELERVPGQKERRWMHRVGVEPTAAAAAPQAVAPPRERPTPPEAPGDRVAALEARVADLEREVADLLRRLQS